MVHIWAPVTLNLGKVNLNITNGAHLGASHVKPRKFNFNQNVTNSSQNCKIFEDDPIQAWIAESKIQ